jgi:site-specific recombinase XerD
VGLVRPARWSGRSTGRSSHSPEEGVITDNPGRRIKLQHLDPQEPKAISEDDFLAILATTDAGSVADKRDRAILCLLYDSGCRVGGLCGLEIGDLDLDAMRALVTEKRRKTRYIMFTEPTREALGAWLEVRPEVPGNWLFVGLSSQKPGPLLSRGVWYMLSRRAKLAGVTGPHSPHSFRHAFAINFLLDSGDIGILSRLMGHADVGITIRWYGRFVVGQLQELHREHSAVKRLLGGGHG